MLALSMRSWIVLGCDRPSSTICDAAPVSAFIAFASAFPHCLDPLSLLWLELYSLCLYAL